MPDFEFLLTLKLRRAATAAVSQPKRPDRLRCRIQAQPLLGHVLFLELTRQKRSITSLLWATLDDRSLSSWRIGCLHINICSCDAKTSDPSRCVPSSLHMPTTSCFTCIYTIFFFLVIQESRCVIVSDWSGGQKAESSQCFLMADTNRIILIETWLISRQIMHCCYLPSAQKES